jgi:hypothetical protein
VPKFELYKHNDELFNIYYRISYELWTFADFDRLCKLEKSGDFSSFWLALKQQWTIKISSPLFFYFELGSHLGWKSGSPDTILEGGHPRIISAKFGWDWLCSFRGEVFFKFHPPEILIVHCCFSASQNELKF